MKTLTPIKVIRAINEIYNMFYDISGNFGNKFFLVKNLTNEDVKRVNFFKKIKLAKILKNINKEINSKHFKQKSIFTVNRLIEHFEEFQRQIKINVYAKYEENENRVLFHYNPIPTYSDDWNNFTKVARGIVIDLDDNSIIVHPYNKFHNFMEKEYLLPQNLPNCDYEVSSKLDGSEGILYPLKNEQGFKIITKGSFDTEQGQFGTKILLDKYKNQVDIIMKEKLFKKYTFVFEILYAHDDPNRIVVSYDEPDIKLIGLRDMETGQELSYNEVIKMAKKLGFPATELHDITLDEIQQLRETMENFEGWVVRYENGLYMKIKCSAYLDAHGAKYGSSPKYVFNLLQDGKYDDFIASLNYDFKDVPEKIKDSLVGWGTEFTKRITDAYHSIPNFESQKDFALYVQSNIDKELWGFMFHIRAGRELDVFQLPWSKVKDRYQVWLEKINNAA